MALQGVFTCRAFFKEPVGCRNCHLAASCGSPFSLSKTTLFYSQLNLDDVSHGDQIRGCITTSKLQSVISRCLSFEDGRHALLRNHSDQPGKKSGHPWCRASGDIVGEQAVSTEVVSPENKNGKINAAANVSHDQAPTGSLSISNGHINDLSSTLHKLDETIAVHHDFACNNSLKFSAASSIEELLPKQELGSFASIEAAGSSVGKLELVEAGNSESNTRNDSSRKRRRTQCESDKKLEDGVLNIDGVRIVEKGVMINAFWCFGNWLYKTWLVQETSGTEHLPLHSGVFFLASNHSSHLDCGALFIAAWTGGVKNVYALGARDYFFSHPFKAWFVSSFMHVIPFNRRGFSQREVDIVQRIKEISSPESPSAIIIFPEGTRSKDGSLQRFKSGVSFLSGKLAMPVVPACVKGTLDSLPKGRTIPHRHKIEVQFGKPLEMRSYIEEAFSCSHASTQAHVQSQSDAKIFVQSLTKTESQSESTTCIPLSPPPSRTSAESQRQLHVDRTLPVVREDENTRALRRLAQQKFIDDLRNSILLMLGDYGHGRGPLKDEVHRPIADRLGGRKWKMIGWLGYWLPMGSVIIGAVSLLFIQSWKMGGGEPLRGYAAAGVFGVLKETGGRGSGFLLGIVVLVLFLRALIQWAWPIVVLAPRVNR